MQYKTYSEAKADWLPSDAKIIAEYSGDPDGCIVIWTWKGDLNIERFFSIRGQWSVSADYNESLHVLAAGSDV